MKYILHSVFLILCVALQATLFNFLEIAGVKPSLFLAYVICLAFFANERETAFIGFVFGLAFDFLIGQKIGTNAVLYLIVGYFLALGRAYFLSGFNFIVVAVVVFLASVITETIYLFVSLVWRNGIGFWFAFVHIIMIKGLYNAIIAVVDYFILKKFASAFADADR